MGSVRVTNKHLQKKILEMFPSLEIEGNRVYGGPHQEVRRLVHKALSTFPYKWERRPCGCCYTRKYQFNTTPPPSA